VSKSTKAGDGEQPSPASNGSESANLNGAMNGVHNKATDARLQERKAAAGFLNG
jgi:hypothetical protein